MTDLRQEIITAIEDVFVRTLRIDMEEDVPALADNIMEIFANHIETAFAEDLEEQK